MNVTCPECRSVFRVDPSKVAATSVRARCSVCGGVITVSGDAAAHGDFAASRPPALAPAPAPAPA
ncbi:MAG: family finger-like protein, partial [Gemmatimonadetes bacterium]|nr:family finger-like protein [Gemmatimonadota bacterium]